jgi:hypothetical protein
MKIRAMLTTLLLATLLITACSPEELAALGEAANTPEVQIQALGAGQAAGGEQAGANVTNQGNQSGDAEDAVSSGGGQSAAAPGSSQAGQMPSASIGSAPADAEQAKPVNWLTYVDEPYKFSIQYPDSFVILPEIDLLSENVSPGLVHQVRFQTRQLAEADTAALELPQFIVEVFKYSGQNTLDGFIKSLMPFPNMTIEPYTIGKLTGVRVSTNRMLAPNMFYFFSGNGVVYKLTPIGQYSPEMLQSFAILP